MATMRSQPNDNHVPARSGIPAASQNADSRNSDSQNTGGQEAECRKAVKEEELTTQLAPDATPPLAQLLFDRLNQTLDDEFSPAAQRPPQHTLHELGELIRHWRLQHNYTRPQLAAQLAIEVDRLLCLERGIARPQDISEKQLHTLATLLQDDEMDHRLKQCIKDYLATLP